MKLYFAPMEGVTGYIYRNLHNEIYGGVDKYFCPFLSPGPQKEFSKKEIDDILPEHNENIHIVPQILANRADTFLKALSMIKSLGYKEVNLNLGCPSGTVVAKGKGAGFLADTTRLSFFLDEIFKDADIKISIKTRIGKTSPDEFEELLDIYNQFPVSELIIHPRLQTDYYKNHPNMEVFGEAAVNSALPVCYNGDICSVSDYRQIENSYPMVKGMMIGRGAVACPAFFNMIRGEKTDQEHEKARLLLFHDKLYENYRPLMSGDRPLLFRMKEMWSYMVNSFEQPEKYYKKIRKAENCISYSEAVKQLFSECAYRG